MRFFILILTIFLSQMSYAQDEGTPDLIRGHERFTLLIKVEDASTNKIINGAEVYLYATASDQLLSSKTTINGLASFSIDPFTEYEVRTCHTSYFKNGMSIYECNEGNEVLCTFGAKEYNFVAGGGRDKPKAILKATLSLSSMNIGSVYELEAVYYDLDKATLRKSAKSELDELARMMLRNKSITIELSSHTDSRATDDYNLDLSQDRAKSCYDYLITKGIASSRIRPIGYGETKLVNGCTNDTTCTEDQHQENRRTEIEIITYEPIACQPSIDIDFNTKNLTPDYDDQVESK